jgi:hypothetical protein
MSNGKIRLWMRGLIAAAISGGAGGGSAALGAMLTSPEHYQANPAAFWQMVGLTTVVSVVIGVGAFLKQSPLPPE